MDYLYSECLNPILIQTKMSDKHIFYKYTKTEKDKIKIIGNLKKINRDIGNMETLKLLQDESIIKAPCRKCINCRLKNARQWSMRNSLESRYYEDNEKWFLTLTYDNEERLITKNKRLTLIGNDITNFMKKLRKHYNKDTIKFFACGEYGSKTYRPHFHLLLYGLHIEDLDLLYTHNGNKYFNSETIKKIWGQGIILLSNFSDATASYTSQYVTKKIGINTQIYDYLGIKPEFIRMSNRPTIGYKYYEEHKNEFYKDEDSKLIIHQGYKTIHIKPFNYYDRLYDVENPTHSAFIKENKKKFLKEYDYLMNYQEMAEKNSLIPLAQFLEDTERKILNKKKGGREYGESY